MKLSFSNRIQESDIYFLYLSWLENYTDIEISFRDCAHLDAYNELCKHNAVHEIIDLISQAEVNEISSILNMTIADVIENERSIAGYLDSKFAGLAEFMNSGLDVLNQFMSKITSDDKLMDKIKNKIEKVVK